MNKSSSAAVFGISEMLQGLSASLIRFRFRSFGAFMEDHDRLRLENYMHKQTKLKMPELPDGDSIFNYNVNVHTGKW